MSKQINTIAFYASNTSIASLNLKVEWTCLLDEIYMHYKEDTEKGHTQCFRSPKPKMASGNRTLNMLLF